MNVERDRERLERCLEMVAAFRASGLKAQGWAEANGVELSALQSWCAHAGRWRARLDGVEWGKPGTPGKPSGFVAARLALAPVSPTTVPCIRVDLGAGVGIGSGRIELHWPLAHSRELASWLRELGR